MTTRQDVVDALVAERYGPSLWWAKPPASDSPATVLQRQMLLAELADDDDTDTPTEETA